MAGESSQLSGRQEDRMARVALDLNRQADRDKLKATWRRAEGLVPGEPNQGLVATLEASPAPKMT